MEPLSRLVMKMVSSRLATIRAKQREKKTSGRKREKAMKNLYMAFILKDNSEKCI